MQGLGFEGVVDVGREMGQAGVGAAPSGPPVQRV